MKLLPKRIKIPWMMSIHKMFVHEFSSEEFSSEERMKLQLMNEILWTKLTFPIIADGSFREWKGRVLLEGNSVRDGN